MIVCPWCDKKVSLNFNGNLKKHQDAPGKNHICTGSGRNPASCPYNGPEYFDLREDITRKVHALIAKEIRNLTPYEKESLRQALQENFRF